MCRQPIPYILRFRVALFWRVALQSLSVPPLRQNITSLMQKAMRRGEERRWLLQSMCLKWEGGSLWRRDREAFPSLKLHTPQRPRSISRSGAFYEAFPVLYFTRAALESGYALICLDLLQSGPCLPVILTACASRPLRENEHNEKESIRQRGKVHFFTKCGNFFFKISSNISGRSIAP